MVCVPVLAFFQIARATVPEAASRPKISWNEENAVPLPMVLAAPQAPLLNLGFILSAGYGCATV